MTTTSVTDARSLRDALLMARPAADHDGAGAVALAQMIVTRAALGAVLVRGMRRKMHARLAEQAADLLASRARFDAEGLFQQWLAEPANGAGQRDGFAALGIAAQLRGLGYRIRRKPGGAWRLVPVESCHYCGEPAVAVVDDCDAGLLAVCDTHSTADVLVALGVNWTGKGDFPLAERCADPRALVMVHLHQGLARLYLPDGSVWEKQGDGKPYMVRAPRAYAAALDSKERAA